MADILSPTGIEKPIGGEQHSRSMLNRNYDRTNQIAIESIEQAEGLKYNLNIVSNSGSITALTVISNIASFTFKADRKYVIEWDFTYQGNTAGNYINPQISSCSTADAADLTTGLTILNSRAYKIHDAGVDSSGCVRAVYKPVADTTVQLKFLLVISTGAGTGRISGSPTQITYINIYDEGAQI